MTDDEFRDLAERTQQIEELTETHGWALYVDRVAAEVGKHNRRVLGGNLTPEEYQRACGVIQGLQAAVALPEQTRREFEAAVARRRAEAEDAEELQEAVA